MLEVMVSMNCRDEAARKLDDATWRLLGTLTRDKKVFPKAVLLGSVLTDIAELTIDGGSSEPIKIRTGADGHYNVFADNYQDGIPGRIIIEIAHPVKKERRSEPRLCRQKP